MSPDPSPTPIQPMEIVRINGEAFHLFLDIFVDANGQKLTAVSPHYGDDIDWQTHGVDFERVVLTIDALSMTGHYIPHRLDTWEPCILIDFTHPQIEALFSTRT